MYPLRTKFKTETKIVLIYLATGFLWIYSTDHYLSSIQLDIALGTTLQTTKGFGYVLVTGLLLHLLLRRYYKAKNNQLLLLEAQNKKLREIAWVQSHVVRAPLSRLMALAYLISENDDNTEAETKVFCEDILVSARELDDVIRDISKKAAAVTYSDRHEIGVTVLKT